MGNDLKENNDEKRADGSWIGNAPFFVLKRLRGV